MAVELDFGLKPGGIARRAEALLVEHRSVVKPPQHEPRDSRPAP
jgi:hypothetical protein